MNNPEKLLKICPSCKLEKDMLHPAISRRDNKTEVCSDCGTAEALDDFFGNATIIEEQNLGDTVICDWSCGQDYTDSKLEGGVCFGSKACCPKCEPEVRKSAKEHSEEKYLGEECPKGKSFADWVRQDLRKGKDGKITMVEL